MNLKIAFAAAALSLAFGAPALAATSLVSPCTLSVGSSCLFKGNINAQLTGNNSVGAADDAYNAQTPTPNPLLNLAGMSFIVDQTSGFGANQTTGSITAPFLVSYYAVKAGNFFELFEIAPSTTFNWSTAGIHVGNSPNAPAISHIEYFGSSIPTGAVPEPATWAMMVIGFGGLGAVLRRRRQSAFAA
jgi:hypothetical protein